MLYQLYYDELVNSNYFNNKKKLNKKWYNGSLGIEPIDNTIQRAFKTGYLHHIERLMVMLNFMVLARLHPDEIYNWFMEFSCDSYDWVMIGNVYGMGYFNTNTMRKPYISTSNYIRNMSNYKNDGVWNETWDALFYKFLTDNKSKLKGGAAVYLRNLVHFEKKSAKEKKEIFNKIKI
jgi:deoxyribodipyrimidine photolyase-related protein